MRLGGLSRMPHRMGGGVSNAIDIYNSLKHGRGTHYSLDDSSIANCELAGIALAIDRARAYQAAGFMQSTPELAAYNYDRWLEILGITLPEGASLSELKRQIRGVRSGNGIPDAVNIVSALEAALGETVTIITAQKTVRTRSTGVTLTYTAPASSTASGELQNGYHYLYAAAGTNTTISNYTLIGTINFTSGSDHAIAVNSVTIPSGYDWIEYYMSTKADSPEASLVHIGNGTPFLIDRYPRNMDGPGLHHISVVVSEVTDSVKTIVHAVLGIMLSAWTTYDVIESTPFILDTAIPDGSPLGTGGL